MCVCTVCSQGEALTTPINTDICRYYGKEPRSCFCLARDATLMAFKGTFCSVNFKRLGVTVGAFFGLKKSLQFQVKHGCSPTWHADPIWMTLASPQGKCSSVTKREKKFMWARQAEVQCISSHSESGGHSGLHLKSKAFPGNDLLWNIHPCALSKLNIIVYMTWFMKR